ncbi:MAG: phosphoribosyltransferase regulatory subunit [Thermosediminibacterales bacterium]|nr:phosphoribosyltransferase regulatory subunit [Thermosediminibacterales bacterium]MDK2835910.1 phosphoribosyltransferase regulatory subunit [Thermosediminibacterales bacterium]
MFYMYNEYTQKPYGVRDFLPDMAKLKRKVENKLLSVFEEWGYEEIITPSFEYLETFLKGNSFNLGERIFKFFDRRGRVLALKPDMTTPIARVISNHYKNVKRPIRLCYFSNIFRFEEPRAGRQCEFHQAGVELVGIDSLDADAEIIALSMKSLEELKITDLTINIGHIGFLEGLLSDLFFDYDIKQEIKGLLQKKDFVGLRKLIENLNLKTEDKILILHLTELHGKSDVIEKAKELTKCQHALKAVEELDKLVDVLKNYNVDKSITVDLGLTRGLDYYTGIVFEIYSPFLGYPICGGGRYDNLIAKFGDPRPATGFAFNIEGILQIIERNKTWSNQ